MKLETATELLLNTGGDWPWVYAILSTMAQEKIEGITFDDWNEESEITAQIILAAGEAMREAPDDTTRHSIAFSLGCALRNLARAMDLYEKVNGAKRPQKT
ncbi:MAG TPA: hypothetical protein VGP13_03075 [Candidatus Paceibacterota bacterium]|jgi:hypothetical protein|nr:hypothetical protein [Candidatus Paceibacterota bacterium]